MCIFCIFLSNTNWLLISIITNRINSNLLQITLHLVHLLHLS
nr:MAG TPA: hypothetical protein [Crassvirales sp.]